MHILMILEELNGKDFHQGGIITLVSGEVLFLKTAFNGSALEDLLNAGVLGLKSLMCPSGINGFLMTNASHIKNGINDFIELLLIQLYLDCLYWQNTEGLYLYMHAEKQLDLESDLGVEGGTFLFDVSQDLATFMGSVDLDKGHKDIGAPAEGAHLHSVHLSDSSSSLELGHP
ncbi:unnamed protein product [Prunus armeniaca]